MKAIAFVGSLVLTLLGAAVADALTLPTVPIGNPGNPADTRYVATGVGSVPYPFRMGATEITNAQYVEFLNAVAKSDPKLLYDERMTDSDFWPGGIVRNGTPGNYSYAVKPPALGQGPGGSNYHYDDKPVTYVTWYDAIRFANWLHNGCPTGPQDASTTEDGAYRIVAPLHTIRRSQSARWWLPNEDEWYKSAYYDPIAGVYHDYPTGMNIEPNNNSPLADTGNSANFIVSPDHCATSNCDYPLTDVGAYALSASAYDTYDQGGNVREWIESFSKNFGGERGMRGGSWGFSSYFLRAVATAGTGVAHDLPVRSNAATGFRVAAVIPEPSSILLLTFGGLIFVRRRLNPAARRR